MPELVGRLKEFAFGETVDAASRLEAADNLLRRTRSGQVPMSMLTETERIALYDVVLGIMKTARETLRLKAAAMMTREMEWLNVRIST
jgi:hypothetical protein